MSTRNANSRTIRHRRLRAKVTGTASRPRLAVFRSLKHITAQLINDEINSTLLTAADKDLTKVDAGKKLKPIEVASAVGKLIGAKAKAQGIIKVVFDRGGYAYHGRVQALADGAREAGLEF